MKTNKRRILALLLTLALLSGTFPVTVMAEEGTAEELTAEAPTGGEKAELPRQEVELSPGKSEKPANVCGDALTWALDEAGTLTVSGTGAMWNYGYSEGGEWTDAPWSGPGVKSVVAEAGVTTVGDYAFYDCTGLTDITLPEGVTTIGNGAFYDCGSLRSVNLPASLQAIGDYAFEGCTALTDIYYFGSAELWNAVSKPGAEIPASATVHFVMGGPCGVNLRWTLDENGLLTVSGTGAMYDYEYEARPGWYDSLGLITALELGEGITHIGDKAFESCYRLTSVTLPASVKSIGRGAFGVCPNLTELKLNEGLQSIGDMAFCNCVMLPAVCFPATLQSIGNWAFEGCESLTDYSYAGTMEQWVQVELKNNAFPAMRCTDGEMGLYGQCGDNAHWTLDDKDVLTVFGTGDMWDYDDASKENWEKTPWYNYNMTRLIVEEGITGVGDWAFYGCTSLTDISLPESLKTMGKCAFSNCWDLLTVTLPAGVTSVSYGAFSGCLKLQSVTLPEGVTSIGFGAFEYCWLLKDITLPVGLTTIGENAFAECHSLTDIYYIGSEEQWNAVSKSNAEIPATATVHCDYVIPGSSGVKGVTLLNTKATAELYRTDYTTLGIFPEPLEDGGAPTVSGAVFADPALASLFTLRVVDNDTLKLIPTDAAIADPKAVKSSYKSALLVTVGGEAKETFTTETLTLTVKKSTPKLKAAAVKFNTLLPDAVQSISFSGETVLTLASDYTAAAKAKKDAIPAYIEGALDNAMTLNGSAPAKGSGKLYLQAELEGWAIPASVVVSFTLAATNPTVSFKPSSVTVKPGTSDAARLAVTVKDASFAALPLVVTKITEGKTVYTPEEAPISVAIEGSTALVRPVLNDGKAHSYKVYVAVEGIAGEFAFTVKTLAEKAVPTLSAKASGTVDTGIPYSPITLTYTMKNFNTGSGESYALRIEQVKPKTKTEPEQTNDVTEQFGVVQKGSVFTLTEKTPGTLEKGCTYYACAKALGEGLETAELRTKLSVKWTDPAKVKPTVTLKASGSIDVLRPGTAVTLSVTVKNCYTHVLNPAELVFTLTEGKVKTTMTAAESPFAVETTETGFVLTVREGAAINHKTQKYTVGLNAQPDGKAVSAKAVSVSVKQGSVKLTADVKELSFSMRNPNSRGTVTLTPTDATLSQIRAVTLDAASAKLFMLTDVGGNRYAVEYKDHQPPTGKAGSKTLKLSLFFEGNETTAANATVSLKVDLK